MGSNRSLPALLPSRELSSLFVLKAFIFHLFFLNILFVRERVHKQGELQAEGEAGIPLSKETYVELDSRIPGS